MTPEIHRLTNGMRIVVDPMPGMQSACVGVWVDAGCRHETAPENGIAHFLEHMAFKGTARRSALDIAEAIEDVGGYINAYTSREMTAYYARVLSADVPLALDVVADIVLNPAFAEAEIEVERDVILQEIGQALDTPDDIIFDWLQETAFPGQAMGRPILGPAAGVAGFGRDDLTRFVGTHYGPEQLIVAAAGAVDAAALVRQAEDLFGHLERRPAFSAEPARFAGGERREVKPLEQAHVALALNAPGYRDDDIYVAQLYAALMGGGMSSRLFQQIREKRGLCYSIFAQSAAYADCGAMTIYAGTGGARLTELLNVVSDELRRVGDDLTEAEVTRARTQMKAGLLMGLEGPSGRAERAARMVAIWDRVPELTETVARIDAVSRADIARFSQELCAEADPALALYGPVETAPDHAALRARLVA